jgi:hypothetical protein
MIVGGAWDWASFWSTLAGALVGAVGALVAGLVGVNRQLNGMADDRRVEREEEALLGLAAATRSVVSNVQMLLASEKWELARDLEQWRDRVQAPMDQLLYVTWEAGLSQRVRSEAVRSAVANAQEPYLPLWALMNGAKVPEDFRTQAELLVAKLEELEGIATAISAGVP